MIDIRSNRDKRRYQNEMLKQMVILERRQAKELSPILNRQYFDTAKMIRNDVFNVNAAVNRQADRLYSVFYKSYKRAALVFTKKVISELSGKGMDLFELKKEETDEERFALKDKYWLIILAFIRKEAGDKVLKMNNTTKTLLQLIIIRGMEEGKSSREIARDIWNIGLISNPRRALGAAKTMMHSASVFSTDEAIKSTGLVQKREWVTARDERVRTSPFNHRNADGETVGPDEKFVMTGEPMDYPGDPKGSAENVYRCRCLLIYRLLKKAIMLYEQKRFRFVAYRRRSV